MRTQGKHDETYIIKFKKFSDLASNSGQANTGILFSFIKHSKYKLLLLLFIRLIDLVSL